MHEESLDELLDKLVADFNEGRFAEAIERATALTKHCKHSSLVFSLLGAAHAELGQFELAAECFENARAMEPDDATIAYNHGRALLELERYPEAAEVFSKAVEIDEAFVAAHYNRGLALFNLGQLEEAACAFRHAVEIDPDHIGACNNLGTVLSDLGLLDEAEQVLIRAMGLDPTLADVRNNLAMLQLQRGDFTNGWQAYEWRKRIPVPHGDRECDAPLWLGEADLNGKSLFVHCEQGLGDTLQFIRYAPLAKALGAKVTVAVPDTLLALLRPSLPGIDLIGANEDAPVCDCHCPMMSLPLAFGTRIETIPAAGAYLTAERSRVRRWEKRLGPEGFRIGVCWQGQSRGPNEGRFFPISELRGVASLPGIRLISLHKGSGEDDLLRLPDDVLIESLGNDFDPPGLAFVDTAAVIALCDLVITADTSVAHLAGALGAPVWLVLQAVPEWRWLLEREDSPWYPSIRLFRQKRRGDWKSAFVEVERELAKLLAVSASGRAEAVGMPRIPASWGEVLDKISILEIKLAKASEALARHNIAFELASLREAVRAGLPDEPLLETLCKELAQVNSVLWHTEDQIRLKERAREFDDDFVELARTVYLTNDRRFTLKNQINRLTSSPIHEQKIFSADL